MRRLRRLAGLLGAAAAGFAHAQDAVRPLFAWPDGLVTHVQTQKTRSRQTDDQAPAGNTSTSRHVMRSQRDAGRHLVSFSDLHLTSQQLASLPPAQRAVVDLLAKAALPGYVVSGDGDFVAIKDLPAFQAAMRSAMAQLFPSGAEQERLKPVLETVLSGAMLTGLVEADWNWMVGAWTGSTDGWEIGESYVLKAQGMMPVVNAPVTQLTRFRFARKLPCERDGKTHECVELLATMTPDDEELRQATAAFVKKLAPAGANMDGALLKSISNETTLELITETATLVPHYYKLRKVVTTVANAEPGKLQTRRQVEETEQTFRYPGPASADTGLALPQGGAAATH